MPERKKEWFLPLLALIGSWLFTIIYWSIAFLFFFGTFKLFADRYLIPALKLWARVLLFFCRIRIEHVNPITFPDQKPRVCVCNHQSLLDILWGSSILPPRAMAIGKKEFIFIPIINVLWHLMKNVRIDRGDRQKALASLSGVASEIVKNSRSLTEQGSHRGVDFRHAVPKQLQGHEGVDATENHDAQSEEKQPGVMPVREEVDA